VDDDRRGAGGAIITVTNGERYSRAYSIQDSKERRYPAGRQRKEILSNTKGREADGVQQSSVRWRTIGKKGGVVVLRNNYVTHHKSFRDECTVLSVIPP
jgi:hypothetical protein